MGLGSGIRKKPIPDPGTRGQKAPDPGSGSATLIDTIDKGQKMGRRRKNVTGPKKNISGTETGRRY
jgi:hypothetical protein